MRVVIFVILLLLELTPVQAGVVTPRLISATQYLHSDDTIAVMVRLKNPDNITSFRTRFRSLSPTAFRKRLIQELQRKFDSNLTSVQNGVPELRDLNTRSLWLVNAFAADIPVWLIDRLAAVPAVDSVDLDAVVTLAAPIPATFAPAEWNIDMVKAPTPWSLGYTGQGVVVASMDTGVDINHADLTSRWRGGNNSWFDPYGQHATPADTHGHGTATTSVMVGGDAGGSSIGMAPGAQWIAAKIFNDAGSATVSGIHQAFQWFLDPDGDMNTDDVPDVVNASWGIVGSEGICVTEFQADVQALKAAEIAVVFSAGNSGPGARTGLSPATYLESYAVGAVDQNTDIASFSSRGPGTCETKVFPNVVAPGVNVKVADLTAAGLFATAYVYASGTSFSAPHVAGAMALLKSALPDATVAELETAIDSTAIDILNPGTDNASGWGLMNIADAYFSLPVDTDGDGIFDGEDTCILLANADQRDTDGDGYGNRCDADLNNDGIVNFGDFGLFRLRLGSTDPDADFNGDGIVNFSDFGLFRLMLGSPPGPSGLVR